MKMKETDSTLKIIPTPSKMRTDSPKGFSIDAITRFHAGSLPRHRFMEEISQQHFFKGQNLIEL